MSLLDYVPYLIAFGIAVAIPGPGVAAGVAKALGSGFRPAFYLVCGIVLGDLTYLTFAVLGLAAIASVFSGVFVVVKWAGIAYLTYLAWHFWRAGIDPTKMKATQGTGFVASFLGGYSITLGNPKAMIFYLALLPTVIDLNSVTFNRYLVLVGLTILVLFAVLTPYIALASRARTFLSNPKALKILNRSAATAMLGAALVIATRE